MNMIRIFATVSGLTMVSRITGLIRETLMARIFGVSAETDAFFVAFRIPNLLRRLFGEGAFSQAFVPILGEFKAQRSPAETKTLIDNVATVLVWSLLAVTLMGILGAPWVVWLLASGMQANNAYDTAVLLTRIMFPYIFLISLAAGAAGVLNTWKKFAIPAVTPVLLNLSFIVCALFLTPYVNPPVMALAIAVVLGGIAQLAVQVPALIRIGMLPRLTFNLRAALADPGVGRILRLMVPATLSVSVAQISLIINTNIASHLAPGSVSWITYADRLMEFPTALLGVALGTVLLPSLSEANADGDANRYAELLDWGVRLSFLLALPAAIGLWLLGTGLTATLFHYGLFSAHDVFMTRDAVIAYGVGLLGLILVKILAPGYYAKQDIRTPVKIALFVLAVTQLLNLLFVPWFAHAGLALAIGLGACLNAALLFIGLLRRGVYRPQPGWAVFLLRLLFALSIFGVALWFMNQQFDWIALRAHPGARVGWLAVLISASALLYFLTLSATGMRLKDFKRKT
jgi:putative peptidoglycan lipid II flippase